MLIMDKLDDKIIKVPFSGEEYELGESIYTKEHGWVSEEKMNEFIEALKGKRVMVKLADF